MSYEHLSFCPQCDELGYESQVYGVFDVIKAGSAYCFPNLILEDNREGGRIVSVDVTQRGDDGVDRHCGTIDMSSWDHRDEWGYLTLVADWLLDDGLHEELACDFC